MASIQYYIGITRFLEKKTLNFKLYIFTVTLIGGTPTYSIHHKTNHGNISGDEIKTLKQKEQFSNETNPL